MFGFEVKSDAWVKSVDGGPCVFLEALTAPVLVPAMLVVSTASPGPVGEPVTVALLTVAVPIRTPGAVLWVGMEVFLVGEYRLAPVPKVSTFLTVGEMLVEVMVVACDGISGTEIKVEFSIELGTVLRVLRSLELAAELGERLEPFNS